MAEQVRVQLMLEWMEKNPRAVNRVQDQLKNLHMTYMRSAKGLRQMGMDEARLTRALELAREQYQKEQTGIVDIAHSREFTTNVLKRLTKEEEKARILQEKRTGGLKRFGQQMSKAGYKMGWMGFRMTIMGKMMMRWIQKPIQDTIKLMLNWEKAIETTAEAMGMLAYAGELTGERQDFLMGTIEDLLTVGPEFQAMWLYLQSAITKILTSIAEPMIGFLEALADAIVEAGPELTEILVPALQDLADTIIDLLPDIMELARTALPSFVKGIEDAAGFMVTLFQNMGPILPYFAELLGYVVGISPLLVAIGTGLYALSPALIVAGLAFSSSQWLWARFSSHVTSIASGLVTAKDGIIAFGSALNAASGGMLAVLGPIVLLTGAIAALVYFKDDIQKMTDAFLSWALGVEDGSVTANKGINKFLDQNFAQKTSILENIDAMDAWKGVLHEGDKALAATGAAVVGFGQAIWNLFGGSPIPELIDWLGKAENAVKGLRTEMEPVLGDISGIGGGGAGYSGPNEVIVYVTQYITGGVIDEDELSSQVADAASRGLGRAFRRRFR